jgi:uncharacterized protein YdaL
MAERDLNEIRRIMHSQPYRVPKRIGHIRPSTPPTKTALILYDSGGGYGYIGNLYARQLDTLCTHFNMASMLMPVEQYSTGMMSGYTATFYFGTTYQNALPPGFLADAMTTATPLVWMGYNLWQIAWNSGGGYNPAFSATYGFQFNYMDGDSYQTVNNKGVALAADPGGLGLANVTIQDSSIANIVATATDASGNSTPYLIHAGNLWFTAENPLEYAAYNRDPDRSAVIEDSIHDVIGDGITSGNHRAVLRIDQVQAETDSSSLKDIANYMGSVNAPYAVCVIPHYRDPRGYYTGGSTQDVSITAVPDLVDALNHMVSKGGQLVMQGDTHQYDDQSNPTDGVSADDMEFYQVSKNPASGALNYLGPADEDTPDRVHSKVEDGLSIMESAGWTPTGWATPHYMASLTDYEEFAQDFQYSLCRGNTFTSDANGNVYFAQLCTPWPIVDDLGMTRMPENIGYFSTSKYGIWDAKPWEILNIASLTQTAIRDSWIGCWFHPTMAIDLLKDLVGGLQQSGFTLVNPGPQWVGQ